MATTTLGPISTQRVNTVFYVSPEGFPTIQSAVDYARAYNAGVGLVVIEEGMATETIPSVANGTPAIVLSDQRNGNTQYYAWGGASYTPADFVQLGEFSLGNTATGPSIINDGINLELDATDTNGIFLNFSSGERVHFGDGAGNSVGFVDHLGDASFKGQVGAAEGLVTTGLAASTPAGSASLFIDPAGTSGSGSANLLITGVAGKTDPAFNLQMQRSDGSAFHTYLRGEVNATTHAPLTLIPQDLRVTGALAGTPNSWEGAGTLASGFLLTWNVANGPGETDFINAKGPGEGGFAWYNVPGSTLITSATPASMTLDGTDALHVRGAITAAGSPVITAATLPPPTPYPAAGIGVSTGSAWGASINPATLQPKLTLTTTGSAGPATLVGATLNVPTYAGGGMVYPGAGLALSNGSAWSASIDPATIAFKTAQNTFAASQLVQGKVKAYGYLALDTTASNTSIGVGNGNGIPTVNLINANAPADQKLWTMAALTNQLKFSADNDGGANFDWMTVDRTGVSATKVTIIPATDITGALTVQGSPVRTQANTPNGIPYPAAGLAVSTGAAWGAAIDPATLPRLNVANTFVGNQSINGDLNATGNLNASGFATMNASSGTVAGKTTIRNFAGTGTAFNPADAAGTLYLCIDRGTGGTCFGNGAGTIVGSINGTGDADFNGTFKCYGFTSPVVGAGGVGTWIVNNFTGGSGESSFINHNAGASPGGFRWYSVAPGVTQDPATPLMFLTKAGALTAVSKNFRIEHPLDKTKHLTHSCLEGPEIAVFYRGEATLKKGAATVKLPDYFEALTYPEDRSVLLTQIFEGEGEPDFATLAVSRIKDGMFRIRSNAPSVKVAWEVKAVRRYGEGRLEVVTKREKIPA